MEYQDIPDDSEETRRATFFLVVGFCAGLALGVAAMIAGTEQAHNRTFPPR